MRQSDCLKLLMLLLQLSCQLLQSRALLCPAPFSMQAGLCVFVSTAQSHSWCKANRQCASIEGELVNSHDSVKLFWNGSISNANSDLWVGLSDLADERNRSRAGWQRVNGNGIFPEDGSLFVGNEPSGGGASDCLRLRSDRRLADGGCGVRCGLICEFVGDARPPTAGIWIAAAFKREKFRSAYCFMDVPDVSSAVECVSAAMNSGSSRHVLYNSKLRACRLLLFTDAQVEADIQTSADWVKFRLE